MAEFGDLYRDRPVLITGHTGFKGTWLAEWLGTLGAAVTGYALEPPTEPSLFDAIGLEDRIHHVIGDVRNLDQLGETLDAARPEVVFHLAAKALVLGAYSDPDGTFKTNTMGTVNLLEAVRRCRSVRAVVVVTTDKVYDNPETGRSFVETDPLGGRDPYGASKAAAEIVTAAYRDSFFADGPAVATARAGNVIGGGDWALDRIVPDSVRALTAGAPIVVRNPDAVRPWQHVLEPLSGYLWLGARLLEHGQSFAGPWNFGPVGASADRPVRWLVERFLGEWGEGSWRQPAASGDVLHEARLLQLDSTKARETLGWSPVWDAPIAIARTAAWYREYHGVPSAARSLVEADLRAYQVDAGAAGVPWAVERERMVG